MPIFRETKNLGRLMHIEPDPNSQYLAYVWFDYNLNLMRNLKEGDFLAVESFSSLKEKRHYVILQIIKKMPRHYALPTDLKGYPGFLMEAAKSASQDWTTQIEDSIEDTTKIICEAIPINFGFYFENTEEDTKKNLKLDFSLPMPGKEVKILDYSFMEYILNLGLNRGNEGVTEIGHLQHNEHIKILLNIENLIRHHFGIFGFTGAGKSNLISSLISKTMERSPQGTKVIIFDLMGEYLPLLIDLLINYPDSKVIGIGAKSFTQSLYKYYDTADKETGKQAVKEIIYTTLYPKKLVKYRQSFWKPFAELVKGKRFKLYDHSLELREKTIEEIIDYIGGLKASKDDKSKIEEVLKNYKNLKLSQLKSHDKLIELNNKLEKLNKSFGETSWAKGFMIEFLKILKNAEDYLPSIQTGINLSISDFINEINNRDKKAVYIIQSHDPDELKKFVYRLTMEVYEERRKNGRIEPLVSFIFDEADEFIPQDQYAKGESKTSRAAIEILARRGRKFGIGIGIATQRVVYLDTNIMAQPHTYLISKLPRKSDRERVAEAFAISESIFEQTFRFGKGDWLLVSHDATGLESVPFPIHSENAEERIIKFLEKYK